MANLNNFTYDIAVTDGCNLKCSYCFANPLSCNYKSLNEKDFDKIFDIFENTKHKYVFFKLYGGEPLLNEDMWKFLKKFHNYKTDKTLNFAIITNGTLLNGSTLDNVLLNYRELNNDHISFSLTISMDGDKENHNHYRKTVGGQDTYDTVINNVKKLSDFNEVHFINVQAVLTPYFLENSSSIYKNLKNITEYNYSIRAAFVPMFDNTFENFTNIELDKMFKTFKENTLEYSNEFKAGNFSLFQYKRIITKLNGDYSVSHCNAGAENISFCPDKKIYPCNRFYHEKVHGSSMGELHSIDRIEDLSKFAKRYKISTSCETNCKDCEYGMKKGKGCLGQCIANQVVLKGCIGSNIKSICRYNYKMKDIAVSLYNIMPERFNNINGIDPIHKKVI